MSQGGQDESGEKSHDPTPQKIEEARKKGDIAKSMDLSAAASYLGFFVAIAGFGTAVVQSTGSDLMLFLERYEILEGKLIDAGGRGLFGSILGSLMVGFAPLILLPVGLSLLALVAQRAFVFAPDKVIPKLSRLSLIQNAKNKFGVSGLVEFLKNLVKMLLITLVVTWYLLGQVDPMIGAIRAVPGAVSMMMMDVFVTLVGAIFLIAVSIGAVDFIWQTFHHIQKLRMTHEELKEETKRTDGDPHLKSLRRQKAQDIATNRMMLDVPKADVIMVNPTHYAVALKWEKKPGTAPVCVAKGQDEVAARIREIGAEAGVPIHRDAEATRAMFKIVRIGQEIRTEHYRAVAAAIQFADRVRRKAKERKGE